MFKSLFVAAVLFAGLNSFAEQTAIPSNKVSIYVKAVQIALADKPLSCNFTTGSHHWTSAEMSAAMTNVKTGVLNSTGEQPVLFFENWTTDTDSFSFSVSTSNDYKSVIQVNFQQSKCVRGIRSVNLGTITEPLIEDIPFAECVATYAATCK